MNVLSLFDGISCGQVALNRAAISYDKYFASEIDQNAIKITQNNFPETIQIGSVVDVKASSLPKIDLLMGGSPCQGFSFAGKQLNFDDPRSKLFFEFVRLKKELDPEWFLLENVKMKKEYQDKISELMGCEPVFIDSKDFSAQSRKRLYWTNIPIEEWVSDAGEQLNDILLDGWESDREKSYCIDANYGKGTNFKRYFHRGSRQIVFRHGRIPGKPTEAEANEFQRTMQDDWRMLTPEECERLQTLPDGYTAGVKKHDRYHALGNGWTVDVIAHIFKGMKI